MDKAKCAIALGSNLGDSLLILEKTITLLSETPSIDLISHSHWYKTAPIGPPQPDYLNGCAILETCLIPEALLQILLNIEQQFGRIRREKWGPRTLDLDLLLYGDFILETPILQVPHPGMIERAFVLVPLSEIAPNWIHPVAKKTIIELLNKVNCEGVNLYQPRDYNFLN
ncbi:2-amino-4-hydroxy-6-hydroxymethyldihydropteridine diphosphokinase [Aphanothece sacrum]|uniref:2-amino-4-hydroxy-6-hydroxymethyldihydropteridine diphosphokinase n=1 Tax=Aphanothece sacrum FPU1 TaxID=1920663 RepID=A0A401IMC1_APHSA|nr:2-amino-4-hydroxy-6-hydroxymethyldihydropteridine diphosphokinase [Aphanothece sacrum]GBF82402.1 2-amino-4-hydroxy-6-hydroxymethyldihydropteridine pyrophosphokinase [Aphanothece sacrum FPU1]GBF84303.1 2-amino-4-hydroxy-6-hydroxymethyldihydropteridine pyrophosphokinase [Aphanothece sacrum FPU3]